MSKTQLQQQPKKIWVNSKIITDSFGFKVKVRLYKYVYPEVISERAELKESRVLLIGYPFTLAPQNIG